MQIDDFKSIVSTFADPLTDLLFEKSKLIISINGELKEISLTVRHGDIFVDDGDVQQPASQWIVKYLARLPLLANRLKESIGNNEHFIHPTGRILPSLEMKPDEQAVETDDALKTIQKTIDERSPLETTALYITSDAGEGKTSLINQLAYTQAARFCENKTDWLLVPIPLGGRHFLRFDDITVGALQNRYRFGFLYYNSFLALVKMGVLVPAFDGFEEMFVESGSGEALSAMGLLVSALESKGTVLIATRRAYFEFENLRIQEKLYDTLNGYSVGFGKLDIFRWSKTQFLAYCRKRKLKDPESIYDHVSERLTPTHSLLTRPVLVRRLVDIASTVPSMADFLQKIQASGPDFFAIFVRGIIEREAIEKWIDRSGDVASQLLTVDEHCVLLSHTALSMWDMRVDYLKRDHLHFVADYFSETKGKKAAQASQIRERILGHALLVPSANSGQALEFDHEEFRLFFLGEGLAEQISPLNERARIDVLGTLRRGLLPKNAQHAFMRAIKRCTTVSRINVAKFLLTISSLDGQASYCQENCSALLIRLLNEIDGESLEISGLVFAPDALRDKKLSNLIFTKCYFSSTSLESTELRSCKFVNTDFGQLRLYDSTRIESASIDGGKFESLRLMEKELDIWEPNEVRQYLLKSGFQMVQTAILSASDEAAMEDIDIDLRTVERLIRYFMRSTTISESVMLMKIGNTAKCFIDETMPDLLERGIFVKVENRGNSALRRYKLGMPMQKINAAIAAARGSYSSFLAICKTT